MESVDFGGGAPRLRRGLSALLASAAFIGMGCGSGKNDHFSGGCEKFAVYAQNRWAPYGTAVRTQPDVLAPKEDKSFAPNEVIAVDGWVHTSQPAYPTNTPPWNSDVWFHVANFDGWVSFAGVRAEPTAQDPTGRADGGPAAPTTQDCEGTYHP